MKFVSMTISMLLFVLTQALFAAQPDRVSGAINSSQTVILNDSAPRLLRPQTDRGPVDSAMMLNYISLRITPSPSQQSALKQLLAAQQDRLSPEYHKWLTPEQFADRFGASSGDIVKIVSWLRSQGFAIIDVARSRNWIAFSGTASQVENVLRCSIHYYKVNGEQHYANGNDISIPKSLAGVVTSVDGLNDFRGRPQYSTGNGGPNYLAPDDIATIYDIAPLFDGAGVSIAIVGESDIYISDITDFRTGFNLPPISLQQHLATGCIDPGVVNGIPLEEADLDLEWSGAVARNATIVYDYCDGGHGGANVALQDVIDNNYASIISDSFGYCEPSSSKSAAIAQQSLIQQANTQGITVISASGDSGAAACDQSGSPMATQGLAVNLPASIPEVTGVGGTEFWEDGSNGGYWGGNGPNFGSALQYIGEEVWNDTYTYPVGGLSASGGGASIYFALPSWQTQSCGLPGIGNCTNRNVPDVAVTASPQHDGYIFCSNGNCTNGIANAVNGNPTNSIRGGTSAAAPVFAGIVAILNQYLITNKVLSKPGLGNINPSLYGFPTVNYPFHATDAVPGMGNIVPCQQGTPDCPASPPFQYGYLESPGGFPVIGLGTPDANKLVTEYSQLIPDFTLTANPTTLTISAPGQSGTTTINVTALGGFSQTVSFTCSGLPSEAACSFATVSGGATMAVSTTASTAHMQERPSHRIKMLFYALALPGFFGLCCGTRPRRAFRSMHLLGLFAVLGLCLTFASCGGSNGANTSNRANPGTPAGASQVTVTAATSGTNPISHQVQITLTVQ